MRARKLESKSSGVTFFQINYQRTEAGTERRCQTKTRVALRLSQMEIAFIHYTFRFPPELTEMSIGRASVYSTMLTLGVAEAEAFKRSTIDQASISFKKSRTLEGPSNEYIDEFASLLLILRALNVVPQQMLSSFNQTSFVNGAHVSMCVLAPTNL